MSLFNFMFAMGNRLVVRLYTANVVALNADANATAAYRIDQDGSVYEVKNGVDTSLGQWISNLGLAPGDYYVRYTNAVGDVGSEVATAAEDTWYALASGDFSVSLTDTSGTALDGPDLTFDVEIKKGSGGSTIDTKSVTLNPEREDS